MTDKAAVCNITVAALLNVVMVLEQKGEKIQGLKKTEMTLIPEGNFFQTVQKVKHSMTNIQLSRCLITVSVWILRHNIQFVRYKSSRR